MKIAIINPGGITNFGERAIMLGTVYELRQKHPNAEIVVFGYQDLGKADPDLHQELTRLKVLFWQPLIPVSGGKFKKFLAAAFIALAPAKALPAQTYKFLHEAAVYSKGQESFTQDYGLVHFIDSFLEQLLVSRITKNITLFGQSIGPVPKYRRVSAWVVNRFARVEVRDSRSQQVLSELGFPKENSLLREDLAYVAVKHYNLGQVKTNQHYLIIPNAAICRSAEQETQYMANLDLIIKRLLKENKKVFIGSSVSAGDWNNDYKICAVLKDKHPQVTLRYYHELKDFLVDIKGSTKVISSRLHPLIMATGLGVSVMALSRSHKVKGLLEDRKLGADIFDPFVLPKENFTVIA